MDRFTAPEIQGGILKDHQNTPNTSTNQQYTFVDRVYIDCGLGVSCKKWQLNTTMKVGPRCIFRVQAQTPRN